MSEATHTNLWIEIDDYRNGGKYNLDYDDISIHYSKGHVSDLLIDSKDVLC